MEIRRKILVVDDSQVCRIVVSEMLSKFGYEVSAADSGDKGLSLFLKNKIDIVLSDYEMPGMDGVALAGSIKKYSPHTPVIIMTGAKQEKIFFRRNTAVDEVIFKPFTMAALIKTIQVFTHDSQGIRSIKSNKHQQNRREPSKQSSRGAQPIR